MKRLLFILSIVLIGFAGVINAQNVTISLPDTNVAVGTTSLNIPLNVQNFNNIGAISLTINYNPAILTFVGKANENTTGITVNAPTPGTIKIGWFS